MKRITCSFIMLFLSGAARADTFLYARCPPVPAASAPASSVISGFSRSRTITIDHTKVDPSEASYTNFPITISTSSVEFSTSASGGFLTGNGFDIVFASDTSCAQKYWLNWSTETVNTTGTGTFTARVQVPLMSSTVDTPITVCLGSSTITSYAGHSTATWDANYKLAWLLSDGTTLSYQDSTSNADTGVSSNTPTAIAGQVDGGARLVSASLQHIDESVTANTNVSSFTVCAWARNNGFANTYNDLFGKILGDGSVAGYVFYVKSNAKVAIYISGINVNYDGTGTNTLSAGATYYLCMAYDATNGLIGYVNGAVDGTAAAAGPITANNTGIFEIGNDSNAPGRNWDGMADELEFSNKVRTPGWIKNSYTSQLSPSAFVSFGVPVTGP